MNRPPPYFPQSQLSPPDPDRYKRFKRMMILGISALFLFLLGAGIGLFYLIRWMTQ